MKPATIYDVARRAGVSHQTVTRYLRGFEGIRPETRERVAAALSELEYRPNAAARMLRSRRSNRIGVIADEFDTNGPARILAAASKAARAHGYVLDVVVTDGQSEGSVSSALETVTDHQVAGIFATAQTEMVLDELGRLAMSLPLVIGPQSLAEAGVENVNEIAGECAADHLLELGHRRIGYVAGPAKWLAAQSRANGFRRRVLERGGELVWVRHGDWSASSGFEAWSRLTESERSVTAVGVGNDSMAIGAMAAALQQGITTPTNLSVVGTDDIPEAGYLNPGLSTVALDFAGEGRWAIEALIAQIEGREVAEASGRVNLPRVVVRASTAAL